METIIIPILHMRKQERRELKPRVWYHTKDRAVKRPLYLLY